MKKAPFLFLILASLSAQSGENLGQQGAVWPIVEHDARAVLQEQAQALLDQERLGPKQDEAVPRAENRFPQYSLERTDKTVLRLVDPSQVLSRDIWAPIQQPDGSLKETLIARKGTRINPLDTIRPTGGFIVVDGQDESQKKLLFEVMKWTGELMPVISRGSPSGMAEEIERPIYFLRPEMEDLFQLRHTPSVIWAGDGDKRGYLKVLELQPKDYEISVISKHYERVFSNVEKAESLMRDQNQGVDE